MERLTGEQMQNKLYMWTSNDTWTSKWHQSNIQAYQHDKQNTTKSYKIHNIKYKKSTWISNNIVPFCQTDHRLTGKKQDWPYIVHQSNPAPAPNSSVSLKTAEMKNLIRFHLIKSSSWLAYFGFAFVNLVRHFILGLQDDILMISNDCNIYMQYIAIIMQLHYCCNTVILHYIHVNINWISYKLYVNYTHIISYYTLCIFILYSNYNLIIFYLYYIYTLITQ